MEEVYEFLVDNIKEKYIVVDILHSVKMMELLDITEKRDFINMMESMQFYHHRQAAGISKPFYVWEIESHKVELKRMSYKYFEKWRGTAY